MRQDYPFIAWLLLALTCVIGYFVLNHRTRRTLRWGRTSTSYPMSVAGAVVVMGTFGVLTATAFGVLPFLALLVSIPLLLAGALYDAWRNSRAKWRNTKG